MGFLGNLFSTENKVKDPVCGMTVSKEGNRYNSEFSEQTYYFCSASCKAQFDAAPENYVKPNQG